MTIEGTWEEVTTLSDKLQGQRVRVTVLPSLSSTTSVEDEAEEDEDDTPLTWEEWDKEREALRAEMAKSWPVGVSALEAVLEQRR